MNRTYLYNFRELNIYAMKRIIIQNFRCYTNPFEIEFKNNINLFIGDNGSGKTSILKACRYVISSFFAGFSDENTKVLSPKDSDFSFQVDNGNLLPEEPIRVQISFQFNCNTFPTVTMFGGREYNPEEEPYMIQKKSKKNSRTLISDFLHFRDYAKTLMNSYIKKNSEDKSIERKHDLPLFASFITDIHSIGKIKADKFKQYIQKPSFGYYECLEGDVSLPYWLKRLLALEEGQKNLHEIEIVHQAIIDALGKDGCGIITKMMIRPNQKKVYYQLTDGREVEAELLSEGYKRLVNIVTDIAFRCALLNYGIYKLEATRQTKGIVLIDDIDCHLHPRIQAKILKCLHHAFPKLQFIVTTHAPMVMTSVENNEENVVYKLEFSKDEGYTIKEINTYGLDCSTITRDILGIEPRDKNVEESLSKLFCLIDEDKEIEARKFLDKLKKSFENNLPELSRAEAMLNFSINQDI